MRMDMDFRPMLTYRSHHHYYTAAIVLADVDDIRDRILMSVSPLIKYQKCASH